MQNAERCDTRRGRDRTASPPAPFTMHGAESVARAGWRAAVPSGTRLPDKRGTVRDAGRGGRWAPSTTIYFYFFNRSKLSRYNESI